MKKNKSDKGILLEQSNSIHKFYGKTSIYEGYGMSEYPSGDCSEFGIKIIFKASPEQYVMQLNECLEQKKNCIKLSDKSIITLYYKLDGSGKIIEHSLSYVPFILDEDNFVSNRLHEKYNNYQDYFDSMSYKYLRIDYTSLGSEEFKHPLVHMHLGIKKSIFRVPMYTYVYPYEFIYIILMHYYNNSYENIKEMVDSFQCNRGTTLSESELSGIFLMLGNCKKR